jgi:hypothetical protein
MLIEGSQTADKLADPKDEKPNRDKSKSKGVPAKQESKAGKSSYFDDMET